MGARRCIDSRWWVAAAAVLLAMVLGGCDNRQGSQSAQSRDLAALVGRLDPFARDLEQINAKLAGGADFMQVMQAMNQAQERLVNVERPITESQQVKDLYERAHGVVEAIQRASDVGVRMLAGAGGQDDAAVAGSIQRLARDYQTAANAFLKDFTAAKQQLGQ